MGERFKRRCNEPGCLVRTASRSGYCEAHEKNNVRNRARALYDAERHDDPVYKLYNCVAWERMKNLLRNRGNLVCQRIVDGKQCTHLVEIYHHIISPREDPTVMYSPRNIVGVCRQHHPITEGEPKENLLRLATIYIPTIWTDVCVG